MCPLHHSANCDCRYVIEGILITGLVLAGIAWLVGDKLHRSLRGAFK